MKPPFLSTSRLVLALIVPQQIIPDGRGEESPSCWSMKTKETRIARKIMKIRNLFTDIRDNISDDKKGLKSAKPTHWGGIDHIGERSVATSRKRPEVKVAAVEWVGGGGREIGGRGRRVCSRAQRIENGGETREYTSEGISGILYTSGESTGFPAWGGYHLTISLGRGHLKTGVKMEETRGKTRQRA